MLAPPLDEGGAPKLPFDYIHQDISKDRFDSYPAYAIEFARFAKLIHYADIQLTNDEIYDIAEITESLRKSKDYGFYILYDRFLLAVREASLQKDEIDMVRSMYQGDEKDADQDLILVQNGIHRQIKEPETNFSFFRQLSKLVGGHQEAFKYRLTHIVAYYIQREQVFPNVQKLSAIYVHSETDQEVEIEGIEFFQMDEDKVYSQKLDISEEVGLKYLRVHYSGKLN